MPNVTRKFNSTTPKLNLTASGWRLRASSEYVKSSIVTGKQDPPTQNMCTRCRNCQHIDHSPYFGLRVMKKIHSVKSCGNNIAVTK